MRVALSSPHPVRPAGRLARPAGRAVAARSRAGRAVLLRTLAVLALLALLAPLPLTPAAPAAAADGDAVPGATDLTWGLAPADTDQGAGRPNFAYAVEPGQTVQDAVVVSNRSGVDLTLAVYGADASTTTSGDLDLLPAAEASTGLGTWLTPAAGTVTVPAGGSVEVPFTLAVPADARPGDHAGGVVTSVVQAASADGATVSVDRRLALRVHARVAGRLAPAVTVSDVRVVHHGSPDPLATSSATVTYTLTNTGNARVVPTEAVTLAGPGGVAAVTAGEGVLPEVLPGSSLERTVEVAGVRPLGRLSADVAVTASAVGIGGAGATTTADAAAATWAVPWTLLAVVVVLLAAAVWGPTAVRALRGRGGSGGGSDSPGAPPAGTDAGTSAGTPAGTA